MKLIFLPSLLALVLWSCSSPLDTDTPRKITPLTPAIKVQPLTISPTFNTATGAFQFKGTPSILVDTTVSPMRFWMNFAMESVPDTLAATADPVLVGFRINVDSFPGSGLEEPLVDGQAWQSFRNADNVIEDAKTDLTYHTATMLVSEHIRAEGEKRKVTIYVYLITNKNGFIPGLRQDQVLGSIELEI